MAGELLVRRAVADDARVVAEVHIKSWRETYAGTMPPDLLASLDIEEWAARWRNILIAAEKGGDDAAFLVQRTGEPPVGFASCGRQRSEKLARAGYAAEFFAFYVLRSAQRQGAGRRLMSAAAVSLKERGFDSAAVWVLRDSLVARRFYEALGGALLGVEGVWTVEGLDLPDLAYGWRDLAELAALH